MLAEAKEVSNGGVAGSPEVESGVSEDKGSKERIADCESDLAPERRVCGQARPAYSNAVAEDNDFGLEGCAANRASRMRRQLKHQSPSGGGLRGVIEISVGGVHSSQPFSS